MAIKFFDITLAQFAALEVKDSSALYFVKETEEIYKGEKLYSGKVEFVDEFPAAPAQGRLYISNTTKEGKVFVGTEWKVIIDSITTVLTDETSVTGSVSGDAIKTYVTDKVSTAISGLVKVEDVVYNAETKALSVTKNGTVTDVPLDGFITGASYNGETGVLEFTLQGASPISITLPKDNLITGGSYDETNHQVVLTLSNGGTINIPAVDLVNTNTITGTSTISVVDAGDGTSSIAVKVSATEGNTVEVKEDGLYVSASGTVDVSGKLDKVEASKTDELITANEDGTIKTSGVKVGASTIAEEPTDKTVATEVAVKAAIESALSWTVVE